MINVKRRRHCSRQTSSKFVS